MVPVESAPAWAQHESFNLSWWVWLAGPSIAMVVIITLVVSTKAGTFMLMFLAGLQNINDEVLEASEVDGATAWQRFRLVTLPMLRPTLILVLLFLVSTSDPKYNTLTTGLAKFSSGQLGSGTQYPLTLGAALLSTIPVTIVFFRHFICGQLTAAVKG